MRRSPLLSIVVSFLLFPVAANAANIIPCRARAWFENARTAEKRVCRQMDAGSAHVAVLAVAPWEDYVSQMQADLSLTRDEALELALPVTSTHEEAIFSALVGSLKAALPTSVTSGVDKTKAENGTTTSSSEQTTTTNAGDASKVGDAPGAVQALTRTTDKPKISDKPPAFDPVLRRLNALALYQEAKLLSLRIVDTAVPKNYTPYMVSLQITLMPNARREPYDAYTTVTFVPAEAEDMSEAHGGKRAYDPFSVIRIVPLLVTDNMESTRRADLNQQIRDLSLAASAMTGNASLAAAVRKQFDRTVKTESTDFNSLMTVARLSDNSLRVRLGALRGHDHYAVAPRTHNITLLVMVPDRMIEKRRDLAYLARTQLVDAVHGTPLSAGTTGKFGWRLENVVSEWVRDYELPRDVGYYSELLSLALAADYSGFRQHLQNAVFSDAGCDSRCKLLDFAEHEYWDRQSNAVRKASRASNEPESFCNCRARRIAFSESFRDEAIDRIWADVSSYNGTGQYAKGLFTLPEASTATRRFFAKMPVTPRDHGDRTVVVMRGARFIATDRVRARLRVVSRNGDYYVESTTIEQDGFGVAKITFPPVRGLVDETGKITAASALMLSYAPSSFRWNEKMPFESTIGMSNAEIATLNEGGEVAYPLASIIFDDPAPPPLQQAKK